MALLISRRLLNRLPLQQQRFRYCSRSTHVDRLKLLSKDIVNWNEKTNSTSTLESQCSEFCHTYQIMASEEKKKFFLHLAPEVSVDEGLVNQATHKMINVKPNASVEKLHVELRAALDPPINKIFAKIGQTRGGVKFLVDMRRDIIQTVRTTDPNSKHYKNLQDLSKNLKSLLSVWISVGFMQISRVTWDSPCSLLEKISDYEAVHPLRSWTDLKSRVGPYRRVFVFTHPSMEAEPLVVLHVALTNEISGGMSSVLKEFRAVNSLSRVEGQSNFKDSETDLDKVDTAIFYSITSTQQGLQGIELGTHLIKQAVSELRSELPGLKRFSTLSPIPGFRTWLLLELTRALSGQSASPLLPQHKQMIEEKFGEDNTTAEQLLFDVIKAGSWVGAESWTTAIQPILMHLCARYLYVEKRRNKVLDPVGNFHIRNGAVLFRINWLADPSPRGLTNSCGLMVNYRYYLEDLERNSSSYLRDHQVAVDQQVLDLLN